MAFLAVNENDSAIILRFSVVFLPHKIMHEEDLVPHLRKPWSRLPRVAVFDAQSSEILDIMAESFSFTTRLTPRESSSAYLAKSMRSYAYSYVKAVSAAAPGRQQTGRSGF